MARGSHRYGWRTITVFSWEADHLIDPNTGDPTDEWSENVTQTDLLEGNSIDDYMGHLRLVVSDLERKVKATEEEGFKLNSITISIVKVSPYRRCKKPRSITDKRW